MTDLEDRNSEASDTTGGSEAVELEIQRSPDYVHLAADTGVVIDLGRDVEVSFLRIGPRPIGQRVSGDDDEEKVQMKFARETLEVGRVRISPLGAIQVAMTTLTKLVAAGHVDVSVLRSSIEDIIALAPVESVDNDE